MRILNIIEQADDNILSCRSFVIKETSKSDEKLITDAEEIFVECAIENGMDPLGREAALEDGYFSIDDGAYSVKLVWSDPVI